MSARTECKPRLYREHGTIVGIIVIINPQRSYKKLIAYLSGLKYSFQLFSQSSFLQTERSILLGIFSAFSLSLRYETARSDFRLLEYICG